MRVDPRERRVPRKVRHDEEATSTHPFHYGARRLGPGHDAARPRRGIGGFVGRASRQDCQLGQECREAERPHLVQGAPRRPDPRGRNEREAACDARSRGASGSAGPKGDAGAKGDPGAAGVAGYQRVQQQQETPRTGERAYTVPCPGGKAVLGGGFNFSKGKDTDNDLTMIESTAASDSVWEFKLRNRTGQRPEGAITLSVVCATVNS